MFEDNKVIGLGGPALFHFFCYPGLPGARQICQYIKAEEVPDQYFPSPLVLLKKFLILPDDIPVLWIYFRVEVNLLDGLSRPKPPSQKFNRT